MNADLTILYLTLNRMNEKWATYHMSALREAIGERPVISISREPMDFGRNIIQTGSFNYVNIYRQILNASKLAETKYVAVAEDDVLYCKEHFDNFRPKDDEFAYNRHLWSLFSWRDDCFSMRDRLSNCTMIAPRELLIEALTERFDKFAGEPPEKYMGECGRNNIERWMGITERKSINFFTGIGVINLNHPGGSATDQQRRRKAHSRVRAYKIPKWGTPKDVLANYESSD